MSRKEELFNGWSHLTGCLASFFGGGLLLSANRLLTNYSTFAIIVYAVTLISMMGVSAAYHLVSNPRRKRILRILDHVNIYFLIAGTYTPITLISLYQGNGLNIFLIVWGIAVIGTLFKLFYTGKFEYLSLLLYVAMGWLIVLDLNNLTNIMPRSGLWLLFLGGAFYTFGIVFYAIEKIPYNHFIWHLFVLAGAVSHWLTIYLYVV